MTEQERLELVSTVEDEFTEPLERLESALEDVDDEIRDAGRGNDHVRIDVEVAAGDAIAELEALDEALEGLDDDITVGSDFDTAVEDTENQLFQGSPNLTDEEATGVADLFNPKAAFRQTPGLDADGGQQAVADGDTEDGDTLFTVDNIDEWAESIEPFFDRESFGAKGGETSNLDDLLDRPLDELVDMDVAVQLAADDESAVDADTLRELDTPGVGGTMDAIDTLDREGATLLGDTDLSKNARRLASNIKRLRFTMGAFHQIVAATLPLFGVFVGALPAAITGVVALGGAALLAAGALAAITGLGAVGIMLSETGGLNTQPLMERLRNVGGAFLDAFAPLARQFAPLVDSAIASVKRMAGPLADAGAQLLLFRDTFAGAVSFLTSAIPSFTAEALAFAHAAMPLLRGLVGFLSSIDVFGFLATHLSQALPYLVAIGVSLTRILPAVINLSHGFLVVAAAVTSVLGAVAMLLNISPTLTRVLGVIAGSILVLVTLTTLWTIATTGIVGMSLGLARTLVTQVAAALYTYITDVVAAIYATYGFGIAALWVISVLTLGIATVAVFATQFEILGSNVRSARRELEKFANTKSALSSGSGLGLSASSPMASRTGSNVYQDNSTTIIKAGNRDDAARQQYSSSYEQKQHVDSVFGG